MVQKYARLFLCGVIFSFAIPFSMADSTPPVVHSRVGDTSSGVAGELRLRNKARMINFWDSDKATVKDADILSPKSAIFSPDGRFLYVNSLEGARTVVYDAVTLEKIDVVHHTYNPSDPQDSLLFAPLSGFYEFTHYANGERRSFQGKPVESTWSHDGRYLWVPFYRRTFDLNAQDPSAIAVIDARTNKTVRVFETGPLPKMVATSNNGKLIAITHWGDNTVGFIDISSADPKQWRHLRPVEIGRRLNLNYPLDTPVNRDANSGNLLRGTIFTPDDRYLLVSGMAGPLQVIDLATMKHLGSVPQLYSIRHLAIADGFLYGSQNVAASIVKVSLDSLIVSIDRAKVAQNRAIAPGAKIQTLRVGGGARTLDLSPDGKYAFVACNSASAVYVVDTKTMKVADNIRCDSYPVGLALSPDGHRLAVTSQGRNHNGGNALNIFDIDLFDDYDYAAAHEEVEQPTDMEEEDVESADVNVSKGVDASADSDSGSMLPIVVVVAVCAAIIIFGAIVIVRKRRKK